MVSCNDPAMGMFPVRPEKEQALRERMDRLGIREEDLEETFVRSAGPGGQKVNKTSSCVQVLHRPSGRVVKCQEFRSQGLNRFRAREILANDIEAEVRGAGSARRQEQERIRRQKRRRSRRSREKMLEARRRRTEVKAGRRIPPWRTDSRGTPGEERRPRSLWAPFQEATLTP